MYTSASKDFSEIFKKRAMLAISPVVLGLENASLAEFEGFLKGSEVGYGFDQVKSFGSRWRSFEQVYQAMIMCLEERLRKERGPGFMSKEEAAALEAMFLLPASGYMFDSLAKEAVARAAETDHWYMFEKQWD